MDERLTRRAAYSSDKRELLKLLLQKTAHKFNAFALSSAQQRLWFLDQLQPNSPLYHLPAAVHLNGPLDLRALAQSLQALVQRHEVFRTTFASVEGRPVQRIASTGRVPLPALDLRALPTTTREGAAQQLAQEQARHPFDLVHGPLLRTTLLRLDAGEHVLLLTMHHIISDGWSLGVLVRELTTLYAAIVAGRPAALPDLPIQYADYAVWQHAWLQGSGVGGQGDKACPEWERGETRRQGDKEQGASNPQSPIPNPQSPIPARPLRYACPPSQPAPCATLVPHRGATGLLADAALRLAAHARTAQRSSAARRSDLSRRAAARDAPRAPDRRARRPRPAYPGNTLYDAAGGVRDPAGALY